MVDVNKAGLVVLGVQLTRLAAGDLAKQLKGKIELYDNRKRQELKDDTAFQRLKTYDRHWRGA